MATVAVHPGVRVSWPTWLAGCGAVVVALRAPWLGAPLGTDEGGLAMIAEAWDPGHPYAYGPYWLDRPPLLVLLYRAVLAPLGDPGVRVLGTVAAVLLVLAAGALARELGGPGAGRIGAALAAIFAGSAAIEAVFTQAELLAAVPSAASVLCLVHAVRGHGRPIALLVASGLLATGALLVKQSFGEALVAGAVALGWLAVTGRRPPAWPAVYGAAAAAPLVALEIWENASRLGDGALSYALLGFRIDALERLAVEPGGFGERVVRLILPVLGSGLVLLVPAVASGLRAAPERLVLVPWLVAALAGMLGGGSYWAHYLIQLVAPVAVLAAIGLARMTSRTRLVLLAGITAAAVGGFAGSLVHAPRYHRTDVAVADYVRSHARPSDTVQILYARAGLVHLTGLRSPFPYQWSLMIRTFPNARSAVPTLLRSPRRATWVVRWDPPGWFGVPPAAERAVRAHYRRVATVDGRAILLRRDVRRPRRALSPAPRQPSSAYEP